MSAPRRRAARGLQIALIALAIGAIALGIARGEAEVVLRKAMFVCLECIGVLG